MPKLRIFLCHSSSDKAQVRTLCDRLAADGFEPWLDERNLRAGQDWNYEIQKAVRTADAVIVCLSRSSITKEGFVQREIRLALDVADEKPEGMIFVIPARLEDCAVPTRLSRWHWVDLYSESGYDALRLALHEHARSRHDVHPTHISQTKPDSANVMPPASTRTESGTKRTTAGRQSSRGRIPLYAFISLIVFLCCLAVLVLLIVNAEKLTALGLTEHLYYLVLVLMGLAAAGFLFGVLSSSAAYEGTLLGGTLKLGGPVVGAALVVVGGYFFIPKSTTFPLTVYVHGERGPQDVVLRNSGEVILELGPEPRREPIGENGQAYFPAIPANFREQEIPAWVESETYESVEPSRRQRLAGTSVYLTVRRKLGPYKLAGIILDESGNPLPGVQVTLPEYNVENQTNAYGRFEFHVTSESQRMVDLVAQKTGYQTARLSPTLGDIGLNFSLKRSR